MCWKQPIPDKKKEIKKLLCAISSSLWWTLSNATTFLQIICFLKNNFDGAKAARTSEQDYKREDELWWTAPINLGHKAHPGLH